MDTNKSDSLSRASGEEAQLPHPHRAHLDVVLESSVQHGQVGQEGAQVGYSPLHHALESKHSDTVLLVVTDDFKRLFSLHAGEHGLPWPR